MDEPISGRHVTEKRIYHHEFLPLFIANLQTNFGKDASDSSEIYIIAIQGFHCDHF